MHYLHWSNAGFPFYLLQQKQLCTRSWIINMQHNAWEQAKSKHKEKKPSHTEARKRTSLLNVGMVKQQCPCMCTLHGEPEDKMQTWKNNIGGRAEENTKSASVLAFGLTTTLLNRSNHRLAGERKQRRGGPASHGYFMYYNLQWEAFTDTHDI